MKPLGEQFRMHAGIASGNADILRVLAVSREPILDAAERYLQNLETAVIELRSILILARKDQGKTEGSRS